MNKIEIIRLTNKQDLVKLLIGAKFIGQGKTSRCFLLRNGLLLKIYKNSYTKKELFSRYSMQEHITYLSTLKNGSIIAPDILFIYKEEVVAYITNYKKAKTLKYIDRQTQVVNLLKNLDILMEDVFSLGREHFILGDLHDKNILYNGYYYIIDLDFGYKAKKEEKLINYENQNHIMQTLLYSLFNIKEWEQPVMEHHEISSLFNQAIYKDYKMIYPFFETLQEILDKKELNVRDLKRTRLIIKEYNSYYKPL